MITPKQLVEQNIKRKLQEDRDLIEFTIRGNLFEHTQHTEALATIAEIHQHQRVHKRAAGLLLTAEAGFGKSLILQQYQSFFPKIEEQGQTKVPIVNIVLPSRPTDFSLASAALEAMGFPPLKKRENAAEKTRKLFEFFKHCDTEVLLVDELHHLDRSRNSTEFYVALNWIKNLISVGNISVIAAGLPEAKKVVAANTELRRRFVKTLPLYAFSHHDEASFLEFRAILKRIEELLPIKPEKPLHEQNLARRLLLATNGLLDYLCTLIDGAVFIAQFMIKPLITQEVLAASFKESIWYDVPERLNPFHDRAILRPLVKFGEPYHLSQSGNKEVVK